MWINSILQFALNRSQNYVLRATDQYRFRASQFKRLLQTGICLYKIEYLMYRDESPHINTGLQLVYYVHKNVIMSVSKYGNEFHKNDFDTKKR
jgi:predicted alternative tryptophan synthase beta-subunit